MGGTLISCSKKKPEPPQNTQEKQPEQTTQSSPEASVLTNTTDELTPKASKTAFPTLDILPEGSMLTRVRFPRYDKDFTPISLLSADKMTVIDEKQIKAEGVAVELYDQDSDVQKVKMRTKMAHAIYDQEKSTLIAKEAIHLAAQTGDSQFEATGAGLVINMEKNKGFLLGPVSTLVKVRKTDSTTEKEKQSGKKPETKATN